MTKKPFNINEKIAVLEVIRSAISFSDGACEYYCAVDENGKTVPPTRESYNYYSYIANKKFIEILEELAETL